MFDKVKRSFTQLCRPAQLYVALSAVSLVLVIVQNLADSKKFCLGHYSCDLDFSNLFVILGQAAYVLVWTIILNSLCETGYERLSWYLVLIPFVAIFILLGVFMFAMMSR